MKLARILSRCLLGYPCYLRTCAITIILIFIIESIVFNTMILYALWNMGSTVTNVLQARGSNLIDKLAVNPQFQHLVYSGKDGGFKSLMEQTLGRLYILDKSCEISKNGVLNNCEVEYPRIQSLGIDVSGAGEVMFIYRRMQKYSHKPWSKLIVDIGANDGLMSSNSFNFIQWGWNAILVEPQASQLDLAARNLHGIRRNPEQQVDFVQAVLGERDGRVQFKLSNDIVSMESHVVSSHRQASNDDTIIYVDSYSVASFARKYNVPKNFGILSIDAEGASSKILHQWIRLGYRPAYIIYESLHDPESLQSTILKLQQADYTFLTKLGWNSIFEYDIAKYNTTKDKI